MSRFLAGILCLSVLGAAQAVETEKAKERPKEASAKEAQATKETYVKKVNEEVQDWSKKIQSLEERSRKSGSKVREELDYHLKAIRAQYEDIRRGLQELTGASDGAWGNLRRGIEESTQRLSKDYGKAVSSIKKTEKRVSDKLEGK